jgi:hypothetical protein
MLLSSASSWFKEVAMALLWADGFENYGTSVNSAPSPAGIMARKYGVIAYEDIRHYVRAGRVSGYSVGNGSDDAGYFGQVGLTYNDTVVLGVAYYFTGTQLNYPIRLYDGTTMGISLYKNYDGDLSLTRGTGTVLAKTAGLALHPFHWYYIELKVKCATSGTYELRVGGTTVLSGNGDTKLGAHDYHDGFRLSGGAAAGRFDDLYFLDASGTANNDFLGNICVVTTRPDAAGDTTLWTPDSGSNYARVNEQVCADDTSYVQDGTTDDLDLYNYAAPARLTAVKGIVVCDDCKEMDATAYNIKTVCKSSSTTSADAGQAIGSTTYKTRRRVMEQDPDGPNDWNTTSLGAAQFGVQVG